MNKLYSCFNLFTLFFVISSFLTAQDFIWSNGYQLNNNHGGGKSIVTDEDSNIYATGVFRDSIDFDLSEEELILRNSGTDIFLIKYSPDGNIVWAFNIEPDIVHEILQDSDGSIIIIGEFLETVDFDPSENVYNLTSHGKYDIFIAKYTNEGEFIWAINIGSQNSDSHYGDIAVDNNNNIFLLESTWSELDFDPSINKVLGTSVGGVDFHIAKYDENGNFKWVKSFNSKENVYNYGTGISIDNENNIYITGRSSNNDNIISQIDFDPSNDDYPISLNNESFVAKYTNNGEFLWAFGLMGGTIQTNNIEIDTNNNYILSGSYSGEIDFDPSNNELVLTSDIYSDAFIAKYNNKECLWAFTLGNLQTNPWITDIVTNGDNSIFITGRFQETLDFDPSPDEYTLSSNGKRDIFIVKYDNSGNIISGMSVGNYDDEEVNDLEIDKNGHLFITGHYKYNVDFDPSNNTEYLLGNYRRHYFLAKYGIATLSTPQELTTTGYENLISLNWEASLNPDVTKYKILKGTNDNGWKGFIGEIAIPNTSFIDSNVIGNKKYYYQIVAYDDSNNFSRRTIQLSAQPEDITAPQIPSNLSTMVNQDGVELTWSPNSDLDINLYKIARKRGEDNWDNFYDIIQHPDTSLIDNLVTNEVTYKYKIAAIDIADNISDYSDEVSVTPNNLIVPDTPSNFTALEQENTVQLSWSVNYDYRTVKYVIARKQEEGNWNTHFRELNHPISSYQDNYVTNGVSYKYKIAALDDIERISNYSNEVIATPYDITAPSQPNSLSAAAENGKVNLSWSQNYEDDIEKFVIARQEESSGWDDHFTEIPYPDSTFIDSTVNNQTNYYYRVATVDKFNNISNYTDIVSAFPTIYSGIPYYYALYQNYPNPFNPFSTIYFAMPVLNNVKITIYDINGRLIRNLLEESRDQGYQSITWDGCDNNGYSVPSGIYFYSLIAGDFHKTKKMILMK